MTYLMSWERDTHSAKWESIQDDYSTPFDYETDEEEISLEKLMEIEVEEIELEEEFD